LTRWSVASACVPHPDRGTTALQIAGHFLMRLDNFLNPDGEVRICFEFGHVIGNDFACS
jgi:hypothetical protein